MRSHIFIGLLVLALAGFAYISYNPSGCDRAVTQTGHVFIASAFEPETDALLGRFVVSDTCVENDITYHVGEYAGRDIVLFETGVGPDRATQATRDTLNTFTVDVLIFSGVAGAVDTALTRDDVVVALEWYDLETGDVVPTRADMLERTSHLPNVRIVERGAMADKFVTDTTGLPDGVGVVDMETYSIARVAEQYNVPFVGFRGISDFADGDEHGTQYERAAKARAQTVVSYLDLYK